MLSGTPRRLMRRSRMISQIEQKCLETGFSCHIRTKTHATAVNKKRITTPKQKKPSPKKQSITYHIHLALPSRSISYGEKLEIAIYLSPAAFNVDNEHVLQIPRDEAARSELNMFLTAPGFQIDGINTASIPFYLYPEGDANIGSVTDRKSVV